MSTSPAAPAVPSARAEPPGRAEIASRIAAIFDSVLGRTGTGVGDQFFELGGDSLTGMRMLTRLHEEFGVKVRVADLYRHNTSAELADRLLTLRSRPDTWRRSLASTARRRRGEPMPLALAQEGFWEIERATRGAGFFNSVLLIQLIGDVDADALAGAIGDVVRRQTQLRVVFGEEGGRPGQRVVDEPPEITRLDLRRRGERALRRLTRMEYLRGFDLTARPAVRFTMARTADDTWAVVLAVHHIVFDAMSQEVLLEDLAVAYRCRAGDGAPLPPLPVDYLDFAEWQRDTLSGDRLEGHLDALRDVLREPAARIAPVEPAGRFTARIDDIEIPADTVRGLEATAARRNSTLFVVLLAAVADFTRRRTAQRRQVITVQTANRSRPGSEETIGCFSNMLCVGVDLDAEAPADETMTVMRAGLATALEHEEMPFDSALSTWERRGWDPAALGHMPQLGFTLQQVADDSVELPGCRMIAEAILQEEENFDPTSFPLVLELGAGEGRLAGKIHHLVDMWPGDSFPKARQELLTTFSRYSTLT
ncbi:condensation domain-containing protein [Actinoplanes sp. NPDC049265]|uniref:condensation domain-containing protein n=1 Tax=Actinoplanes sp. NPDC049265 TaxID=3363902 RepID=UPI003724BB2C